METSSYMNFWLLIEKYRAPIEESRKWGIYETTNLLFKTYFKVGRTAHSALELILTLL